ncbi:MAG: hypothetical protein LBQ23_02710 [Puniceicoccales bacterium]|nr:hypothetical protein [Puniceicoccales bacterium]
MDKIIKNEISVQNFHRSMESMLQVAENPIQSIPECREQSCLENNISGYDNGHSSRCGFLKKLEDRASSLIKKVALQVKRTVDIVKSVSKKSKPENSVPIPIGDMFKKWGTAYINFLRTYLMKSLDQCNGECIPNTGDPEGTFVAKCEYCPSISVAQAKEFGFILPDERLSCNPNLTVIPLIIRCFGLGSGNFWNQAITSTSNVLSLPTPEFWNANALVESLVESEQQKFASDENVVVVPIVTGFSMGGMYATAIAAKNNWASITFNGLGLGKAGYDFIGEENWEIAQQQPASHINLFVEHDFVASQNSPLSKLTSTLGPVISIPSDARSIIDLGKIIPVHFYKRYFDQAYEEYFASVSPNFQQGHLLVA